MARTSRRCCSAAREVRRAAACGGGLVGRLDVVIGVAVAAVAVVATVDAVRGRDVADAPAETTELADRDALSGRLAALGAQGELVLDEGGCRQRVVELPTLDETRDAGACAQRGVLSPDGRLVARCAGELTEVFTVADGRPHDAAPGCAPAWRPDGTLTAAFDRAVVGFEPCSGAPPCPKTLIEPRELYRAALRHPTVPDNPTRLRVLVDGIAWLSRSRAAVLLSIRMGGRLAGVGALSEIAFFEGGKLAPGARTYTRTTGGRLAASPRGSYVTQTPDVILRTNGSQVSLPPHLRDGLAFAWSPDDRFVALATPFAVHVVDVASLERFDETGSGLRAVTLPARTTDLAWR